jgi:hypothetical protein
MPILPMSLHGFQFPPSSYRSRSRCCQGSFNDVGWAFPPDRDVGWAFPPDRDVGWAFPPDRERRAGMPILPMSLHDLQFPPSSYRSRSKCCSDCATSKEPLPTGARNLDIISEMDHLARLPEPASERKEGGWKMSNSEFRIPNVEWQAAGLAVRRCAGAWRAVKMGVPPPGRPPAAARRGRLPRAEENLPMSAPR